MQLANERTRLHVDGVRAPITADVTKRRDDGMVVTQALPFLRLDTAVTESGRRSRIARVAIAMDGDVPRLLVELRHDEMGTAPEAPPKPRGRRRKTRADHTVPYALDTGDHPRATVVLRDPVATTALARTGPAAWLARWLRRIWAALTTRTSPANP